MWHAAIDFTCALSCSIRLLNTIRTVFLRESHMPYDFKSHFRLSFRRAHYRWKYRHANWGRQPINGGREFVPPGHFYSPIPALDEVRINENSIFYKGSRGISAIEMHEEEQLQLLRGFKEYYDELPFLAHKTHKLRYFFENPAYSYSDAIFLYCMIRYAKPQRIVEVGSGYSSCLMLDTNDLYFNGSIALTFIDPHPELLFSLVNSDDAARVNIISSRIQEVDLKIFDSLEAGDILFIDSTHVSKIFSDVNRIVFEILPRLKAGVLIHFHDIFYPFEYPREWIYEGRAWTEAYLLRAFLQYNKSFRIVLMNTFLERFHSDFFERAMPLCLKNPGGSVWIRKER
jgi:predicted O-methyltransferase YrrM